MWLIDVESHKLVYFQDGRQAAEQYAILSHRWAEEEVTHADMTVNWNLELLRRKKGWYKIAKCCEQAALNGLRYAWVDTCCIDKSSSAELQESINSMFAWYQQAKVCYVYMNDVEVSSGGTDTPRGGFWTQFQNSQWFKRGWTLQELIAPSKELFYDRRWRYCGTRDDFKRVISNITRIHERWLTGFESYWVADAIICVAEIMSWAAGRNTTRIEDRAYSLLGIFGISMPLLYGEGDKAFRRLQEELLRHRDDQSIFAWKRDKEEHNLSTSLADSPDNFKGLPSGCFWLSALDFERRKPHTVSNEGINIELLLRAVRPGEYQAVVNAQAEVENEIAHSATNVAVTNQLSGKVGASFPIREIDHHGRFVRMLPKTDESLNFLALPLQQKHKLRMVTLVNYLKQTEVEITSIAESSELRFTRQVSTAWRVDKVDRILQQPQWENHVDETIQCQEPESVAALLTWNGRSDGMERISSHVLRTLAFGCDFDFNPFCLVYTGWHTYDPTLLYRLKHFVGMADGYVPAAQANEDENPIAGLCTIWTGQRRYWKSTKYRTQSYGSSDARPLIFMIKATSQTRASGHGLSFTLNLDATDSREGGRLDVTVTRINREAPWEITIHREQGKERQTKLENGQEQSPMPVPASLDDVVSNHTSGVGSASVKGNSSHDEQREEDMVL